MTPLGGGAYRITLELGKHVKQLSDVQREPGVPAKTDLRQIVSFTIQTGEEFSIADVDVDTMVLAVMQPGA